MAKWMMMISSEKNVWAFYEIEESSFGFESARCA